MHTTKKQTNRETIGEGKKQWKIATIYAKTGGIQHFHNNREKAFHFPTPPFLYHEKIKTQYLFAINIQKHKHTTFVRTQDKMLVYLNINCV